MSGKILAWVGVSFVLVVLLLLGGWRQHADVGLQPYETEAIPIVVGEGFALLGLLIAALLARKPLARLLQADDQREDACNAIHRRYPYATLFIVSFVALFVEVMFIRYCGSQVRIFAFYRNIPLIGCFLGFGMGCCLGGGRPRHALQFLLWLVPLAVFLAAGTAVVDGFLGKIAAVGSSEQILGTVFKPVTSRSAELVVQLMVALFCVATLVSIALLFAFLGRLLGEAFEGLPRLPAYTVNILGSLAGIIGFVVLSYLQTPPWVWFLVGLAPLVWWLSRRAQWLAATALMAVSAVAVAPTVGETVWSPYQKLVGHAIQLPSTLPRGGAGSDAYLVEISDVFYQVACDLRPETLARLGRNPYPHYDEAYRRIRRPDRVLIVGSGTGNDVAAALRAGARHVDAVDIDPAIVEMGRRRHPERPYDDPRVRVIVNDARDAFRRLEPQSYDAVVFGLLDSHTQLASSSVRLDNYVFTIESLTAAKRLLKRGGHIIVTAATFREWFRDRFELMLKEICDGPVAVYNHGSWYTYLGRVEAPAEERPAPAAVAGTVLPTDDWPFLYLPDKSVPQAYILVVIALAVASVAVLYYGGLDLGRFSSYHGHLFFLGAAFLLLEVHAVNRLALLFGTTWLVSAVAIAIVLLLIVCANFTVSLVRQIPYPLAYGLLSLALLVSYWLQPSVVLGRGTTLGLVYGLILLSPVYFAGLVFARSFRMAAVAGPAIGANMMGSVLGGWVEYSTMATGIRSLVLLALVFYVGSLVCLLVRRKAGAAGL